MATTKDVTKKRTVKTMSANNNKNNKAETLHSLVGIQPRHLRLMQFHLNNYFLLLCEQRQDSDSVITVSELRYLDGLISGIMGDDLDGQK